MAWTCTICGQVTMHITKKQQSILLKTGVSSYHSSKHKSLAASFMHSRYRYAKSCTFVQQVLQICPSSRSCKEPLSSQSTEHSTYSWSLDNIHYTTLPKECFQNSVAPVSSHSSMHKFIFSQPADKDQNTIFKPEQTTQNFSKKCTKLLYFTYWGHNTKESNTNWKLAWYICHSHLIRQVTLFTLCHAMVLEQCLILYHEKSRIAWRVNALTVH